MIRHRSIVIILTFLFAFFFKVYAAETPKSSYALEGAAQYEQDEFPQWLQDLRRFEVVSVGAAPLSWIFSSIAFDLGRYSYKLLAGDPNTALYAPLFFAPAGKPAFDSTENGIVLSISAGLALGVGILDYILLANQRAKIKKKVQLEQELQDIDQGALILEDDGALP